MNTVPVVSKVWSFCTMLRDDGVGYSAYLEQLTYLIFLKMADEFTTSPCAHDGGITDEGWKRLKGRRMAELETTHCLKLSGNRKATA